MGFLPERREIVWKIVFSPEYGDVTAFSWLSHGTAILRQPWRFYGTPWRSSWQLLVL